MVNLFFTSILKAIKILINLLLVPINSLVVGVLPDFSSLITNFNTLVFDYIGGGLAYFSSILPPITRHFIGFYLGLLVIIYTSTLTIHLTLKVFKIIKAIKFW